MDIQVLIIFVAIVVGFVLLWFLIRREIRRVKDSPTDQTLITWLQTMQSTIDSTHKTLHDAMKGSTSNMTRTMTENTRQLNERLDVASKVIGQLQKELGTMSEVGRGIKSLQELLQSPKLRGNLGEHVLQDMIGQTFPKNAFHLQYQYKSGVKVDAMLKTDAGLLPIDAKFPMEQFQKMHTSESSSERSVAKKKFASDVKKHINDISKKYISPDDGTMDFALMYVPSEAVYYDIATSQTLMNFSRKHRVYPVSPNTMYAHLQVLMLSFVGKELEKRSQYVLRLLSAIQKDYAKTEDQLSTLNRHVTNAYNSVRSVSGSFESLGQKIEMSKELPEGA